MSKSTKKVPITGHTSHTSEKYDKRLHNRSYRRQIKQMLAVGNAPSFDEDQPLLPLPNDISTPYNFDKDGKQYLELNEFVEQIRDGSLLEIPKRFLDKHVTAVNEDLSQLSEDSILALANERLRNHMRK
jgi:hypothetical protein